MATDEIVAKFISEQLRPQNLKKQGMLLSKNPTFINRPNGVTNMDFSEIIETQNMPESNVQPSLGSQVLTGLKGVASNIGKLAEKPETWRNLSNVLSVIAAPGNPQLSNVLQNISQSINTNIENKKNRDFQIVTARNALEKSRNIQKLKDMEKTKQKNIDFVSKLTETGSEIVDPNEINEINEKYVTEVVSPGTGEKIKVLNRKELQKVTNQAKEQVKYNKSVITNNKSLIKNTLNKLITQGGKLTDVGKQMSTTKALQPFNKYFDKKYTNMTGLLNVIKANLSFNALQEMRDNSPTGGALGQITERELELLGSTVAALDIGMTEDQIIDSLITIRDSLERVNKNLITDPKKIIKGDVESDRPKKTFLRGD